VLSEVFAFLDRALPFIYLSRSLRRVPGPMTPPAACKITLITKDADFARLAPFVRGFRYAAPWP
jgi:hypothetical protein